MRFLPRLPRLLHRRPVERALLCSRIARQRSVRDSDSSPVVVLLACRSQQICAATWRPWRARRRWRAQQVRARLAQATGTRQGARWRRHGFKATTKTEPHRGDPGRGARTLQRPHGARPFPARVRTRLAPLGTEHADSTEHGRVCSFVAASMQRVGRWPPNRVAGRRRVVSCKSLPGQCLPRWSPRVFVDKHLPR